MNKEDGLRELAINSLMQMCKDATDNYMELLEKENKQLKKKISKAIKLLNKGIYCDYGDCCAVATKELLQVLEGEENE